MEISDNLEQFSFIHQNKSCGYSFDLPWFVCVKVLWPSQPNGVMSSANSLPNYTFTGQA